MKKSTIVKTNATVNFENGTTDFVWIDTCYTLDHGYESMAFPSDSNGKVLDWSELDFDRYINEEEASVGHDEMVARWGTPYERSGAEDNATEETEVNNNTNEKEKNTMTKKEYAKAIAEQINAEVNEVEKANGVKYIGITLNEGGNIRPTVYIDDMYEEDIDIEDAVMQVKKIFESAKNSLPDGIADPSEFTDFSKVVTKLRIRMYNKRTNAEVYSSAIGFGFDDLILVPYVELDKDGRGIYSVKVTKSLLDIWKMSEKSVLSIAIDNTKNDGYECKSMLETIMEIMGADDAEQMRMMMGDEPQMYVMSNKQKAFGAVTVALFENDLKEKFPNGYIVIPSSIHEVIIIPKGIGNNDEDTLNSMVNSVNAEQVAPTERLGDKVYIF